jgi:hypothetical protein
MSQEEGPKPMCVCAGLATADGGMSANLRHQASIHVVISRMALYDHPLFCPEDALFGQLRLMFGDYRRQVP